MNFTIVSSYIFCYTSPSKSYVSMKRFSFLFLSITISLFCVALPAHAADPKPTIRDTGYKATFVSQSEPDPIVIEAGTTKMVKIKFKNTGTQTWNNTGKNYISAYTMEPRNRDSVFVGNGTGWKSAKQTDHMAGTIKPGQIGEMGITLHAPDKVGTYKEQFYLASENWSWVQGGYFFLEVNVVPKTTVAKPVIPTPATDTTTTPSLSYKANLMGLSKKTVSARGGDQISIVTLYQNIGETPWNGYVLSAGSGASLASTVSSFSFADSVWADATTILARQSSVDPGAVARETFSFRAPREKGDYVFTAGLRVNGQVIHQFNIDVHVTEHAPLNYVAPTFDVASHEPLDTELPRLTEEPRIRVGITTEGTSLQFVSTEDDYQVYDGATVMGILSQSQTATLTYVDGLYTFQGGDVAFLSPNAPRLVPINNPHAVFMLPGLKRPMSWVGPGDFNQYRGAFEYRKGQNDNVLYAVNDLFLEDYVKGISETGKSDQLEFVKANLTAARTYAYVSRGKYPFFDVLASTYDQLYLGYNVEGYNTRVVQASNETRGRMVVYQDQVVITPYFGNSNGYTRSWSSVWGGAEKPWLVPVKADYDLRDSKWLFGHGVGMSQRDANIRAKEEGLTYKQLLQYYYTGVDVALMY